MDLFLIIYRNKYLKNKIFKEIKINNKLLKYKRYNYYECPLEVIINKKSQLMLLEKVNDFIKYQDDESIDQLFKYTFDFNLEIFKKLIVWKELDFEILKLMITQIKPIKHYMDNKISLDNFKEIYKIIIMNGTNNIKLLDFIINFYILPKSKNTQDWFNILNSEITVGGSSLFEEISSKISKEMFNYLFKNKDDRIRIELDQSLLVCNSASTLYKIILNGINNQNNSCSNFKVNKSFFKLLKFGKQPTPEMFEEFINQSIKMNDIKMLKFILSKFPYSSKEEDGIECIQLFNDEIQISIEKLKEFQINIDNFNSNELFEIFKILIEKVFIEIGYFTIDQSKSIKINGQIYFKYVMERLNENKIIVNKSIINNKNSNKGIICSHECIINKDSILLDLELMNIEYYKSSILNENENLSKFINYLSKFQFDRSRLYDTINMGYEAMVTYVIKDMIKNLNYTATGNLMEIDEELFITIFVQSLPTDKLDQYDNHYILDLIYPLIKKIIDSIDYRYRVDMKYTSLFKTPLPKDPIKRNQFIMETFNRINKYGEKRMAVLYYFINSHYRFRLEEIERIIYDLPFSNKDKTTDPRVVVFRLIQSLNNGDFKSIKKLINVTNTKEYFSYYHNQSPLLSHLYKLLRQYTENNQFKLLFHLILNLDKLKVSSSLLIIETAKLCQYFPKLVDMVFGLNNFKNFKFFKWIYNNLNNRNNNNDQLLESIKTQTNNNEIIIYQDQVYIDRLLILFQLKLSSILCLKECEYLFTLLNDEIIKIQLKNHSIYNDDFIQQFSKNPNQNQLLYLLSIKPKVFRSVHKSYLLKIFGLSDDE